MEDCKLPIFHIPSDLKVEDQKHGIYYLHNAIMLWKKQRWVNRKLDGEQLKYHSNGEIEERTMYLDGKMLTMELFNERGDRIR